MMSFSYSGYLSTSQINYFEQILSGGSYLGYLAYRTDQSNSGGAVLYVSASPPVVSGSTIILKAATQIYQYSVYSSGIGTRYYQSSSFVGDVSFSIPANGMLYTNAVSGYATLADIPVNPVFPRKDYYFLFLFFLLFAILIFVRRRRHA